MNKKARYSRNLLVALALCGVATAQAQPRSEVDWWAIDRGVAEQLFDRDVGAWARSLETEPLPADASALLERFAISYCAGHDAGSRAIVDALAKLDPAPPTSALSQAADRIIDREQWELARYFLEHLPNAEPGWGYVFVKRWSETADVDAIDRWLAAQARSHRGYWMRERLRFREDHGTAGPLIAELAAVVRAQPNELAPALDYIEAASSFGGAKEDLAWLSETCRPSLALHGYELGSRLARSCPRAAITLLDRSLATPFTDADRVAFERIPMAWIPDDAEAVVRTWTKHALLQVCKDAGEAQRAQALLEELTALSDANARLPVDPRLAGAIQAESGARFVEARVLAAEPAREDDCHYWFERADYFEGRGELEQSKAAFDRALQLALAQRDGIATHDANYFAVRYFLVGEFAQRFVRRGELEACRSFLWSELAAVDFGAREAKSGGDLARAVANALYDQARAASDAQAVDDERWWRYLSARTQWDFTEEKILMQLAEATQAAPESRETLWKRATELAPADPTRAFVTGWVMTRYAANERALPLLADAEQRAADEELRRRATFTRFEACLALGDWAAAERAWPVARRELTPHELPEWFGKIAIAAAREGARDDALRIWRQRVNLDRGELRGLDDMLRAGMREPLIAFYEQLATEDRASSAPARVLARIRESR